MNASLSVEGGFLVLTAEDGTELSRVPGGSDEHGVFYRLGEPLHVPEGCIVTNMPVGANDGDNGDDEG